jgi:hypothetical protein
MTVVYYKKDLFLLCKEIIVSYAFFYCNRFDEILIYLGRGNKATGTKRENCRAGNTARKI